MFHPPDGGVLEVDADLDPISAIEEYTRSQHAFRRLAFAQGIAAAAENADYVTCVEKLVPRLLDLLKDQDRDVRIACLHQAVQLGSYLHQKNPDNALQPVRQLCDGARELVLEEDAEVQPVATPAFQQLCSSLSPEEYAARVCDAATALTETGDDELCGTACQLLAAALRDCRQDLVDGPLLEAFMRLLHHKSFTVREEAALHVPAFVGGVSVAMHPQLLDGFLKLCKDSVWRVRKACCSVMAELPPLLQPPMKELVSAMEAMTRDSSLWVKVCARQQVGALVAALPSEEVSPELLNSYSETSNATSVIQDTNLALACAQHMPAVLARLRLARWPAFMQTFSKLMTSNDAGVLRTMVENMPVLLDVLAEEREAAEAVGRALLTLVEARVAPVSSQFVTAVPRLLTQMPPGLHPPLLQVLHTLSREWDSERCGDWRLRLQLASQLGSMATAVSPDLLLSCLWPAACKLCTDPVACVRDTAAAQVGPLLCAVGSGQSPAARELLHSALELFLSWSRSSSVKYRTLYVQVCRGVLQQGASAPELDVLLAELSGLASDAVFDVRYALAAMIAAHADAYAHASACASPNSDACQHADAPASASSTPPSSSRESGNASVNGPNGVDGFARAAVLQLRTQLAADARGLVAEAAMTSPRMDEGPAAMVAASGD